PAHRPDPRGARGPRPARPPAHRRARRNPGAARRLRLGRPGAHPGPRAPPAARHPGAVGARPSRCPGHAPLRSPAPPGRGRSARLGARIRAVLGVPDRLGLLLTGAPGGTLELLDAFAWDGPVRTLDRGRHRRPGTPERWALGPRVVRGTPRSAPPPHLAGTG